MPTANVLSVSDLTAYIKGLFTADPALGDLWLTGEVSNFKQHTSGHCYFTLKDANASIKAVIWRTSAQRMRLPRDGDAVVVHGNVSVYEQQGVYQLYVDRLEPAGAGRLWTEFERLRARLEAEGLFAESRKRPIPAQPARIGVVTSATGAALRDILRTLAARYPLVEVLLAPAAVQGDQAPASIVAALAALNRWSAQREPLDTILLARGGGSIEELWAFNDERVARAIAASALPVISGVGHETDFTIADFVADLRAPTPTAAAAAATPDMRELRRSVAQLSGAAGGSVMRRISVARADLAAISARVRRLSPLGIIAGHRQRIDDLSRRGERAAAGLLRSRRERLSGLRLQLGALDPARVLSRGYAIVSREGKVVVSAAQVSVGEAIQVRVADGGFNAAVTE